MLSIDNAREEIVWHFSFVIFDNKGKTFFLKMPHDGSSFSFVPLLMFLFRVVKVGR